ncbi:hypothetical protein [Variovorax sp. GT1P44]|uniref:hypothetical protein n=1 Tax=Variovorax sp. GT1P44 TaxID=3443742 RepID=UPI003F47E6C8
MSGGLLLPGIEQQADHLVVKTPDGVTVRLQRNQVDIANAIAAGNVKVYTPKPKPTPTPACSSGACGRSGEPTGLTLAGVNAIADGVAAALSERDQSIDVLEQAARINKRDMDQLIAAVHGMQQRELAALGFPQSAMSSKRARAQRAIKRAELILSR